MTQLETDDAQPDVINADSKSKKKKKPKYSRKLKGVQVLERRALKATDRALNVVSTGLKTYRQRSAASARKKRDGAVKDYAVNIASSVGDAIREVSPLPLDIAKAVRVRVKKSKRARKSRFKLSVIHPR